LPAAAAGWDAVQFDVAYRFRGPRGGRHEALCRFMQGAAARACGASTARKVRAGDVRLYYVVCM